MLKYKNIKMFKRGFMMSFQNKNKQIQRPKKHKNKSKDKKLKNINNLKIFVKINSILSQDKIQTKHQISIQILAPIYNLIKINKYKILKPIIRNFPVNFRSKMFKVNPNQNLDHRKSNGVQTPLVILQCLHVLQFQQAENYLTLMAVELIDFYQFGMDLLIEIIYMIL